MTILETRPDATPEPGPAPDDANTPRRGGPPTTAPTEDADAVSPTMIAAAAALSTSAAAWMAGSILREPYFARAAGLLGMVIGVGLVWLSARRAADERRGWTHLLVVPAAALAGGVLVAPVAKGGTANLPGLVGEALRSGGVTQPPIPFDPGWRFLLVVLFAIVGAAAVGIAAGTGRPKLAFLVPLPLTFGAALVQPEGEELMASAVAGFLAVASMAVSYGAGLASGSSVSATFEIRRLTRGLVMLVAATVLIVVLAQADILFPSTQRERVIPPQRPPAAPIEPDRELFVVTSDKPGPWRTGVLDVYDGEWWLLPPIDQRRAVKLADGVVPDGPKVGDDQITEFRVSDMKGRALPVPAGLRKLSGGASSAEFDPRLGVPRLDARIPGGFRYTATAAPLAASKDLSASPPAAPPVQTEFAAIPSPPNAVGALLAEAPPGLFDRIQFLRDRLYATVVAAGGGSPVAVPPERVAALFQPGAEATPFEITAAEALLARWAGAPARIGFGYYRGDPVPGGFSVRPKHGAAWLEVYFEGHGWVPLVGTPPRAKSSLSKEQQNESQVRPSDELAVSVLIPVRRPTFLLLFEILRYWVMRAVPFAIAAGVVAVSVPALLKRWRSRKRRRWAQRLGARHRILVAYAEMRDLCYDLNVGDPVDTSVEFLAALVPDAEHEELAWLVMRALWGDVKRDCRIEDAEAAEALAASVTARLLKEQTLSNRLLGQISRTSLRDPFSEQIPNARHELHIVARLRRLAGIARAAVRRRPKKVPAAATALAFLLAVVVLAGGCATQGGLTGAERPVEFPSHFVPDPPQDLLGFVFERDASLEEKYEKAGPLSLVSDGRVYAIREGTVVQGTLQIARFKRQVNSQDDAIRTQVIKGVGGEFRPHRIGTVALYERVSPEQLLYLWFPTEHNVMVTFVFRRKFTDHERLLRAVMAYARNLPLPLTSDLIAGAAPVKPPMPELAEVTK